MNRRELLKTISNLKVWMRDGERAPYKALTLLYALGKESSTGERTISFSKAEPELKKLFAEFGPPRKKHRPHYPFTRLQRDGGVWQVQAPAGVIPSDPNLDATVTDLRRHGVKAGFSEPVLKLLKEDHSLRDEMIGQLLDAEFPLSLHESILNAVGIELNRVRGQATQSRNASFRPEVLKAYEWRCAVCGFDVRLDNEQIGLDAAHIRWRQFAGPDIVQNGLSLCVLHHRFFDRGAFTISADDFSILISEEVTGNGSGWDAFMEMHGNRMRQPQNPDYLPKKSYLDWHKKQVFRGKPRFLN